MSDSAVDRNLLFGILALQNNFIKREALLAAFSVWIVDKRRPLGEILCEQGNLTQLQDELLRALTEQHIKQHGNDPEQSLAAVSSVGSIRDELRKLGDSQLEASLAAVSQQHVADPYSTRMASTCDWGGDGLRFRVLRPHAKGGLGEVFVAQDLELHREVALKEIQSKYADHPDSRSRFVLEAEITGGLEHPGIVPVYGLGQYADGRPFYAMRFIRGDSLAEAIARFHKADVPGRDPGDRTLELRKLLGRFIDVCEAIEYAHSRGILHRDLKPGNIMLGKYGETLVVDWGLAKAVGRGERSPETGETTLHPSSGDSVDPTIMGKAIGTPAYMSPEQAAGRLDELGTASDVYSLGATLYCLLTGQAPFLGMDLGAILRRVAQGDFPRPREVKPQIPTALQAICLKAMSRKPADRYESVRAIGADMERYLADESISCYADPLPQRMSRFSRHHRNAVTTAILVLVALIVVGLSWSWFYRDRREQMRGRAERLVTGGEDALSKGKDDDAATQLSEARTVLADGPDLKSLRDRVDRGLARARARSNMTKFLTTTAEAEERILGSLWTFLPHEDPDGRRRMNSRSGGSSKLETGITRAREGLALYGLPDEPASAREPRDLDPESANRLRNQAAETIFLLALAEERVGQGRPAAQQAASREQACRLLDTAEALGNKTTSLYQYRSKFRKLVGRDADADADRSLADRTPLSTFLDHHLRAVELDRERQNLPESATEYRIALAARPGDYWTLYRLAKTLENQKQRPQAEALYRNILALRPNDPNTHNALGIVLSGQRKYAEAIAEFEAAIGTDQDYRMAYGNMMQAQGDLKQIDAVETTFRRFMARQPDSREQARAWDFLGIAYERVGQDVKALERFDESVRLDPENPGTLRNRSLCRSRLRRHAEAVDDIRRAIALKPTDGELHHVEGLHLSYWGRDPAATRINPEAIRRIEEAVSAYGDAIRLGFDMGRYNRGVMLRQLGRYEEALKDHDAILLANPNDAFALYERAMNLIMLKNFRVAINDLDRVLILDTPQAKELRLDAYLTRGKAWKDLGTEDDLARSEADLDLAVQLEPNAPDCYRSRGLTRMHRGNFTDPAKPATDAQAESCRGGIADYQKYLELRPDAPDASSILNDINSAYLKLGRIDESLEVLGKAIQREPIPSYYSNRGNIRMMQGNLEQAVADFDKAVSLDPQHTRAWALRGQARLRQGRFDQATTDLDRAFELEPGFYETLVLRSLANLGGGGVGAARRDLENVARDRPTHVRGNFSRGLLHFSDRQFAEAIVDLSRGMDDPILRPFGLPYRARSFLELGAQGASAAAADADELAGLRPLDSYSLFEAARIHAATGLPKGRDRALELLSQAIKHQPELRDQLGSDPDLKSLQTDDRFIDLLKKP